MSWVDKLRMKKILPDEPALDENAHAYHQRLSLLTTLEYKVFMLLREGFTKKECSQRLNLKRGEVKDCTKSIYSKLDVSSLAELIVKYHEDR